MSESHFTVLGGGGFIGSHLVRHLRAQGHACWVPARDDAAVHQRDLGHVIYAIGLTADYRSRPFDTVEAHVCVLRRLLADGKFTSLTYLSSTRVYAGAASTQESAALQVNPNAAADLYNLSKLMGESLCLHSGHPRMKVARLSNIVGPSEAGHNFIEQLLAEGRRTGRVLLQTALESSKDYLSVADATETLLRISLSPHSGIFNVASGQGVTHAQIAYWLVSELGWQVSVAPGAQRWQFQPIDISKAKRLFGFAPQPFANYFPAMLRSMAATEST